MLAREPAIRAVGLGKVFAPGSAALPPQVAVEDLSFEVQPGEVFGLLGPNGAGKTTTVRLLCALIAPSTGRAWIAGHELGRADDRVRASVGILTETPGLYGKLDAAANLTYFAKLYGVVDVAARVEKYLVLLGLWQRRHDLAATFSRGMRQRLAIARALLHEPPVLFLDEPTSNLDPEAARDVRAALGELRTAGRTLVLCTHNLDEADRLCDRVGVLRRTFLRVDTPARLRRELYGVQVRIRLRAQAPAFLAAARALPAVREANAEDGGLLVRVDDPDRDNPELVRALVAAGAAVQGVETVEKSLESIYLDLVASRTGGGGRDDRGAA